MELVGSVDPRVIGVGIYLQRVGGVHPSQYEGVAVEFDLTGDLGPETTASGRDAPCLQGTPEGSGQSASRSSDEVVDRRGVLGMVGGIDAVVLGDRPVDPERHGL